MKRKPARLKTKRAVSAKVRAKEKKKKKEHARLKTQKGGLGKS